MLHSRPNGFLKYFLIFPPIILPFIGLGQNDILQNKQHFKIVMDPGHGGKDVGTSGKHLLEKDVTFSLAEEIARAIVQQEPNIDIKFTREDDDFIPIHRRVAFANNEQADLFISIHCNAVTSHSPHGIETYVLGMQDHKENLETVKRENASILEEEDYQVNYNGFDPESPSAHIYFSAIQNAYLNESILLAHEIQTQFTDMNVLKDRGVKQAGFVVLRKATMPSILLEIGYLSNERDEQKLMDNTTRNEIVQKIANGILTFVTPSLPAKSIDQASLINETSSPDKPKSMDLIKNNQASASHSKTTTEKPRKMTQSYYTVLIASSANGIIESLKQKEILNYQVRETLKKDVREYTIGQLENLSEAMELQTLARSSGYKGAFVQLETIQIISKEKHSDIKLKFAGVN